MTACCIETERVYSDLTKPSDYEGGGLFRQIKIDEFSFYKATYWNAKFGDAREQFGEILSE